MIRFRAWQLYDYPQRLARRYAFAPGGCRPARKSRVKDKISLIAARVTRYMDIDVVDRSARILQS